MRSHSVSFQSHLESLKQNDSFVISFPLGRFPFRPPPNRPMVWYHTLTFMTSPGLGSIVSDQSVNHNHFGIKSTKVELPSDRADNRIWDHTLSFIVPHKILWLTAATLRIFSQYLSLTLPNSRRRPCRLLIIVTRRRTAQQLVSSSSIIGLQSCKGSAIDQTSPKEIHPKKSALSIRPNPNYFRLVGPDEGKAFISLFLNFIESSIREKP